MKTPPGISEFTWGYLVAAFWTNDDDAPGGCDYSDTDRPQVMFERLAPEALAHAVVECHSFVSEHGALLEQAGYAWHNGADFWLTRNYHGGGFWDRGYDRAVGKALTEAAHAVGSSDLYAGDDNKLYFT